ncbi:alpha/beta hydrolase family protein [Hoyosella altamirensis]|uniref:Pimeloyl-ACP methyl ester carboxylesterase n=1 Tax=Hoyosella altamirensis TaxID=616997 RepID=A0A839RSZ7_9ACTN|nr:alpha/beta fold hydrolase [Hoyosella altamirensis]MBB3039338.1 pimeloyl-ACP methyl ester carboxylesterase [Hoyosella altamirensis]
MNLRVSTVSAAVLAATLTATSCAIGEEAGVEESPLAPTETQAQYAEPELPVTARGELLQSELFTELSPGITTRSADSQRIIYRSTSGLDGSATEVSGAVFVPQGAPPEGGWPVISYAHGTTGVAPECGPSQYPDMLGQAARINSLLDSGYAVVATDYEGLGGSRGDTAHPYLEPATAAYNVIDAVRAARAANDAIGKRWGAVGVSQGGQAVWAASEQADDYGAGLEFAGSVAISPAADLTPIAEPEPPWALDLFQLALLPYVIAGFQAADPSVEFDDYLRGGLTGGFGALETCVRDNWLNSALALLQSSPEDVGPFTDDATDAVREWLDDIALPRGTSDGPLLVLYGDRDTVVPPEWTARAVQRACEAGTVVEEVLIPGADHFNLNGTQEVLEWLDARLRGVPAISTC